MTRNVASPKHCERAVSDAEITPDALEAGAAVIWASFGGEVVPFGSDVGRELAERVYRAMVRPGVEAHATHRKRKS